MPAIDAPAKHPGPLPPDAPPSAAWGGAPLRSTIAFLAIPASVAVLVLVLGVGLPTSILYAIAVLLGVVLVGRMFRDPEWLLATFVLYIPLCKLFVIPIAPGINGTNALLALMLVAWASHARQRDRPLFFELPFARHVGWWAGVTLLSVVTAAVRFGPGFIVSEHAEEVKGWADNFLVFFAVLYLIRDGAMARRVVLYMMLGAVVVLALGFQEWLDKRFLDKIEKARLLGPQLQPNDFGAFLVYISGPFLGLLLTNLRRLRTAVLVPYFVVMARMLLATFSRGAFIGMAAAAVAAGWVRGRAFLIGAALLGATLIAALPELVPASLTDRMSSTKAAPDPAFEGEQLDASSETRLVLWKAAVAMSLESPLLGKGFKAFPELKGEYTEVDVRESDNHNMFLYVASQMGIPALLMLLWLLVRIAREGAAIAHAAPDGFGRAIGIGGVAMTAGVLAVNMFGSRLVDVAVCGYFWIYLAALAHLSIEVEAPAAAAAVGVVR